MPTAWPAFPSGALQSAPQRWPQAAGPGGLQAWSRQLWPLGLGQALSWPWSEIGVSHFLGSQSEQIPSAPPHPAPSLTVHLRSLVQFWAPPKANPPEEGAGRRRKPSFLGRLDLPRLALGMIWKGQLDRKTAAAISLVFLGCDFQDSLCPLCCPHVLLWKKRMLCLLGSRGPWSLSQMKALIPRRKHLLPVV